MKQIKYFFFLFFPLLITGCQNKDEEFSFEQQPIRIVSEVLTRSAMESGFTMSDNIGVFILKRDSPASIATFSPTGNENWVNNMAFFLSTDGQMWESVHPLYWDDQSSIVDVIGYYPYIDFAWDDDMTKTSIQVAEDQSSLGALRNSDFLYATCNNITPADRTDKIALKFRHRLCKLTINLDITVNGQPLNSAPSVMARNLYTNAIINLANGTVRCGDIQGDIMFYYDTVNKTAEAILPPQTIKAGPLIYVIIEDASLKAYTYEIKEDLVMKEGKEYIINFNHSIITK